MIHYNVYKCCYNIIIITDDRGRKVNVNLWINAQITRRRVDNNSIGVL